MPTITVEKEHSGKNQELYKMDNIKLKIELAGVNPQSVLQIQVLSSFKYRLREYLNLDMIGLLHAKVESLSGMGKVFLKGSLNFK